MPALAAPTSVPLLSHRAAYELTLGTVRGLKPIESAQGRIAFEFTGTPCEGYALNFRQVTRISDGEGKARVSDLRSATWEEGRGRSFRFNNQQLTDNVPTQASDGAAERAEDGGVSVTLKRPRPFKVDLDGEAVFPTEHVRRLLEAAKAERSLVEVRVFDGSDGGEKVFDTTAVIGREVVAGVDNGLDDGEKAAKLAGLRRWPVTISYFEPGSGERTPVYVMSFLLFENGVSGSLKLDFGDFTLRGALKSLDPLPVTACKE